MRGGAGGGDWCSRQLAPLGEEVSDAGSCQGSVGKLRLGSGLLALIGRRWGDLHEKNVHIMSITFFFFT